MDKRQENTKTDVLPDGETLLPEENAADDTACETSVTTADIAESPPVAPSDGAEKSGGDTEGTGDADMKNVEIDRRKKKNRWGFLLTMVLFALVVYALWTISNSISGGNVTTFYDLIANMKWEYLLIATGVMLFMMLCDVTKYGILLRSYDSKLGIGKTVKVGLIGKYYSAITPTSTGGQPMQIYYLHKNGVSGAKSSAVSLMCYAVQMLSAAIVAAIIMISCRGYLSAIDDTTMRTTIWVMGWVGFAINACAPVFIAVIIFVPQFLKWLANIGFFLLHKLHLLKDVDKKRESAFKGIDDFAVCGKFIVTHPVKFIQLVLLAAVEPICICVFPYLVLLAFCGNSLPMANSPELFFTIAVLATFSNYAVVFIPTPGNSGAFETMFMLAFASISGDVMFWLALASRFFSYYVYIILGIGMNAGDFCINLAKKIKANGEENDAADS